MAIPDDVRDRIIDKLNEVRNQGSPLEQAKAELTVEITFAQLESLEALTIAIIRSNPRL